MNLNDPVTCNKKFIWVFRDTLKFKEQVFEKTHWYRPFEKQKRLLYNVFTIPKELMTQYNIINPVCCKLIIVWLGNVAPCESKSFFPENEYYPGRFIDKESHLMIDLN